jgi:hypothetical protein
VFYGHAEVNCLKPLKKNINYKSPLILICIRINKTNIFNNSKPCFHCTEYMKKYNISYIVYSDINGILIKEKLNNMSTSHISVGFRRMYKKS